MLLPGAVGEGDEIDGDDGDAACCNGENHPAMETSDAGSLKASRKVEI